MRVPECVRLHRQNFRNYYDLFPVDRIAIQSMNFRDVMVSFKSMSKRLGYTVVEMDIRLENMMEVLEQQQGDASTNACWTYVGGLNTCYYFFCDSNDAVFFRLITS